MLTEKEDMTLPVFLHCMTLLNERPSAFLGEKGALPIEFIARLREFVSAAAPLIDAPATTESPVVSEPSRLVRLVRVIATSDNETDDEGEPQLYALPAEYNKSDTRAFEVVGDSMSGDGIVSGDIVFTRPPRSKVDTSERIAVCRVDGYRHLKRVRYANNKVELESSGSHPKIWRLPEDPQRVKVIGIVIGRIGRFGR